MYFGDAYINDDCIWGRKSRKTRPGERTNDAFTGNDGLPRVLELLVFGPLMKLVDMSDGDHPVDRLLELIIHSF